MIARVLAETLECRNGNCPTAWLTDRGTVVVQGFGVRTDEPIQEAEIPEEILVRAVAALRSERDAGRVPGQRTSTEVGSIQATGRGTFVVRGEAMTSDVLALDIPIGETAVEIARDIVVSSMAQIRPMEAV